MGTTIDCFLLEETERINHKLRRYAGHRKPDRTCSATGLGYHNAETFLGVVLAPRDAVERGQDVPDTSRDDPRWPTHCACGYAFQADDEWQDFTRRLYVRKDTGEEMTLRDSPAGAMWFADWLSDHKSYRGPDGRTLVVKLPHGHEWIVDGQASNCTMPNDHEHKCWVRHGEAPSITVDKNGHTCAAGAGSIATPNYHGFLRGGKLLEC